MSGSYAWGAAAWGSLDVAPAGLPPSYRLADDTGPLFLAAEITVYQPGSALGTSLAEPWGATAWGALTQQAVALDDTATLRASDLGYATRRTDPVGVQAYPPILGSSIEIDRQIDLGPDGAGAAAGWGALRLVNDRDGVTTIGLRRNADGRPVRIRLGRKQLLPHGYWRDPAFGETAELLNLIGAGFSLDERELRLGLRDASYWLERQVDGAVYAGTGSLEGTAALTGKRKPRVRGGTSSDPVREVAPELVDATNGIYQVSDAPGAVVTLYERGLSGGITLNANVADIVVAGAPPAARYNVESSVRGLFIRLGTFPPAGPITVDCTGAFPDGSTPTAPASIALQVLLQDMAVPGGYVDAGSFTGLAAAANWAAGFALAAGQDLDGRALLGLLLRSAAGRLLPARTGLLSALQIIAPPVGTVPVGTLTAAQIVDCRARDLRPPMTPPPWRIRVGWGRNYTTQTTGLAPSLSGARIQELAETQRVAIATNASVLAAWRRPSDPAPIDTVLTNAAQAATLAGLLRDLWAVDPARSLYDVTIPLSLALRFDIGQPIVVAYPGMLAAGALGRIVGEQLRTADNLATLQVLI